MKFFYIIILVSLVSICSGCVAHDLSKRPYSISPTPNWVEKVDFDAKALPQPGQQENGTYQLLKEHQAYRTADNIIKYYRNVYKVLNEKGVSESGILYVSKEPEEVLHLHTINVWRDGKIQSRLNSSEIKLINSAYMRSEPYNLNLKMSIYLKDIRVGDIIEAAYSIEGMRSEYENRFGAKHTFSNVVERAYARFNWPNNMPLYTYQMDKPAPKEMQLQDRTIYVWDFAQKEKPEIESYAPEWESIKNSINIYEAPFDWKGHSAWKYRHYLPASPIPEAIKQVADTISQQHNSQEAQLAAAARWVQNRIRYENNEVHYILPKPAEITLRQRYGDCKDQSYLLHSLLHALDIPSTVVSANVNKILFHDQTAFTPLWFNHVLVMVEHNDRQYLFDPTSGPTQTDLKHWKQYDVGDVLPYTKEGHGLVRIPKPQYNEPLEKYHAVYDFSAGLDAPAKYTLTQTLRAKSASSYRNKLLSTDTHSVYTKHEEEIKDDYAGAEVLHTTELQDDGLTNTITTTYSYRLHDMWEESKGKKKLNIRLPSIYSLPTPKEKERNTAYKTSRTYIEYHIEVILPDIGRKWIIPDKDISIENAIFEGRVSKNQKDNRLYYDMSLNVKKDYITPDEMEIYRKDAKRWNKLRYIMKVYTPKLLAIEAV